MPTQQAEPVQRERPAREPESMASTRAAPVTAGADPTKSDQAGEQAAWGVRESVCLAERLAAPEEIRSATADATAAQHAAPREPVRNPRRLLFSREPSRLRGTHWERHSAQPSAPASEPQAQRPLPVPEHWAPQTESVLPCVLPALRVLQVLRSQPRRGDAWRQWRRGHARPERHRLRASSSGSSCPVRPTPEVGRGSP